MTSSIPDGFSLDQLKSMHEEAIPEEVAHAAELGHPDDCDCHQCEPGEGDIGPEKLTVEQATELAYSKLEEACKACNDPIIHKLMLHMIVDNMLAWHSRMGSEFAEKGDSRSAMGWLRDAGKFQAIANIIDTISVGDNDPTCDID